MLQIAIIGSGPAGCYAAEKLARDLPGAAIDVIDRLPTPFGLIRAGVAPDHLGTKAVTHVFERLFARGKLQFLGNVQVGRDVTLAELRDLYDAVVIASGAPADRRLGIPGEDLTGVIGSGAFVGWYNRHPDHADAAPDLSRVRSAVVIGNGNVALDVVRLLAKTSSEFGRNDLPPSIETQLAAAPLETIHVIGRRGPGETHFSVAELKELAALARAAPVVEAPLDETGLNQPALEILRGFPGASTEKVTIRFHFAARPERFIGTDRLEGLTCRQLRRDGAGFAPSDTTFDLRADLAITCIGYAVAESFGLNVASGVIANENGRVDERLYVVGWAKRGASGTIATNRLESHQVATRIAKEVQASGRPGGSAVRAMLASRGVAAVDWDGWTRIDAAEQARAASPRVREKFAQVSDMMAAALARSGA